jgi:hypothetical protein
MGYRGLGAGTLCKAVGNFVFEARRRARKIRKKVFL